MSGQRNLRNENQIIPGGLAAMCESTRVLLLLRYCTVVQHGGGDLGPIGCVSIKSCHNSCRGIITECVEAGRGAVGEIGEKGDF